MNIAERTVPKSLWTLWIDYGLGIRVDEAARKAGMSRAQFIREALRSKIEVAR